MIWQAPEALGRRMAAFSTALPNKGLFPPQGLTSSSSNRRVQSDSHELVSAWLNGLPDSRYDDLKSGRVQPIDGEAFLRACASARTSC